MRHLTLIAVLVCVAACDIVPPSNRFDPETPPEFLARGVISGQVRAVFERDAEGQPLAAGACDRAESDTSGGFTLTLRSARGGGEIFTAISNETRDNGLFVFEGVPAGSYSLEIVGDGFDVPPPFEFSVGIGETRDLGALCALNTSGPAAPALAPLPAVIDGASAASPPTITIVDAGAPCVAVAGASCPVAWAIDQARDGVALAPTQVLDDAAAASVTLLVGGFADRRGTVTVTAVATDALGNQSSPTVVDVVIDDSEPGDVVFDAPVVGRDRITIAWRDGAVAAGDDLPARYAVFYALEPRVDDDVDDVEPDACPVGRPRAVDPNGSPSFVLEGRSPVETQVRSQTLSGIASGSEVFVYVAGIDAAGNAGCYSSVPLIVRPDVVVFAPDTILPGGVRAAPAGAAVGGVVAAAVIDGVVSGTVAMARGGAGLTVVGSDGESHADSTPTFDVAADGRQLVTAVSNLGVRVTPLDETGAPGAPATVFVGADVRSIHLRANVAVVGTTTGIALVDLAARTASAVVDPGARGAVLDVTSWGPFVVLVRTDAVQVVRRSDLASVVATASVPGAREALVHGETLVVAAGRRGLTALDLGACVDGASGCLRLISSRELPRQGDARRVLAFDEFVAVGVNEGATAVVQIVDPARAFELRGRSGLFFPRPADVTQLADGLVVEPGLVCAAGVDATARCFSSLSGPLIDSERRLVTAGPVTFAVPSQGEAIAIEGAREADADSFIVRAPLLTMQASHRQRVPRRAGDTRFVRPFGGVVLDDLRLIVIDETARVLVADPGTNDDAVEIMDLAAILESSVSGFGDVGDEAGTDLAAGHVARVGSDLLVALAASSGATAFVRLPLRDLPAGLGAGTPTVLALDDVTQVTNLVVRGTTAFVPSQPFGVQQVTLAGPLALAPTSITPGNDDATAAIDVAFVAIDDGVAPGVRPVVFGVRGDSVTGLFDIATTTSFAVPAAITTPDPATAVVAIHRFLVASLPGLGLVSVLADAPGGDIAFTSVAGAPSPTQAGRAFPTARGVLVSDIFGGVVLVSLR